MQQTEPGNQPTTPAELIGGMDSDLASRLVVIAFEDAADAEKLYESLKELDKKDLINLEDAVFVTKGEDGEYKIDERMHHEKRKGTTRGAVLGVLIGFMLGGPIIGLAGGAIIGRMIGKRVDLGIDKSSIESITNELEAGNTALFIAGSSNQAAAVVEAFKGVKGKIIETTVEADVKRKLQNAMEDESGT